MTNFKLQCFLDAAEELLRADETLRALNLLENLPAYYRDHEPSQVTSLRRAVQAKLATASFYATSDNYELSAGAAETYLHMEKSLRGQLMIEDMKTCKSSQYIPRIIDLGPGEYWLPRMLTNNNFEFVYQPIYVNRPAYDFYKEHFKDALKSELTASPTIFFAGEVIEHLHNENEIRFEMERHSGLADLVHISTPKYTFDTACEDWKTKGDLGHLRAYTPREFYETVSKMFPEYTMVLYDSQILHARLVLKETAFSEFKKA